jgi:hypothetical protein
MVSSSFILNSHIAHCTVGAYYLVSVDDEKRVLLQPWSQDSNVQVSEPPIVAGVFSLGPESERIKGLQMFHDDLLVFNDSGIFVRLLLR